MAVVSFTLRGDQIATYTSYSGNGNGNSRVVTVEGVQAIGTADEIYTVVVEQVNDGTTQFQNGQFVTIYDSAGNVVMARTGVNPDAEQGLAAGDEHMLFTQSNFLIDYAGFDAGSSTYRINHSDEKATPQIGDNDGEFDWTDASAFVCIAAGSRVETLLGPRAVETLQPGDRLPSVSGEVRRVLWVGHGHMTFAPEEDAQKPILFPAGCFGGGMPARDLRLSPQHRVLLEGPQVRQGFGADRVLAPARGLLPLRGVRVMRGRRKEIYVSVLLDRHDVVLAEGAPVESFWPGPEGMKRLQPLMRRAVQAAIPGLVQDGPAAYGSPAAPFLKVGEARRLCEVLRQGRDAEEAAGGTPAPLTPRPLRCLPATGRKPRFPDPRRYEDLLATGFEGRALRRA